MNMPNQGARQVFLYDHGRPHWSQGGPLFYDRRVPPPPPQMGNFPNPQIQGPSPQWVRGPFIGGPGQGPNQQQFDGFGIIPWGNQGNFNNYNRYPRTIFCSISRTVVFIKNYTLFIHIYIFCFRVSNDTVIKCHFVLLHSGTITTVIKVAMVLVELLETIACWLSMLATIIDSSTTTKRYS